MIFDRKKMNISSKWVETYRLSLIWVLQLGRPMPWFVQATFLETAILLNRLIRRQIYRNIKKEYKRLGIWTDKKNDFLLLFVDVDVDVDSKIFLLPLFFFFYILCYCKRFYDPNKLVRHTVAADSIQKSKIVYKRTKQNRKKLFLMLPPPDKNCV